MSDELLFNPQAFEQMSGQTSMTPPAGWCDDAACPADECVECKTQIKPSLAGVRALFPVGAVIECVENTYIPARNGTRRTITRSGTTVCDAWMDGKPYRMPIPTRVRDIVALTADSVTYRIGKDDHTITLRVIS